MAASSRYPLLVKRDLDGFFGLFTDNLVQLLLIVQLGVLAGIPADSPLLVQYILPAAGASILIGNLFYAWQAHRLARRENRSDVTALPYGINTPSLLVYYFFVIIPVYQQTGDPRKAWQMGLLACLGSGIIELAGSLVAEPVRRRTPRAALLSTLAGIAVGFISMKFALEIYQRPLVAMLPMGVILVTYFARASFPLGLPGGVVAIAVGTAAAWLLPLLPWPHLTGPRMEVQPLVDAWAQRGVYPPRFVGQALWETIQQPTEWLGYLSVIIPMGLFNVVGSLQNIESAEAAGDRYDTRSSMAVNGLGTLAAALLGSCFPTTIYIGHPGWKGLGARAGYSLINGLAVALICFSGTVTWISHLIPIEAGIAIVLWIGIIITAQAFQATPAPHAPAVAIGLFPAIAAWGATVAQGAFLVQPAGGGSLTMEDLLGNAAGHAAQLNGFLLHGLITMERGYIFSCMILAAITAHLVDRQFRRAAWWSVGGAVLAVTGFTHAYRLEGNTIDFLFAFAAAEGPASFRATGIALGYLLMALLFVAMERWGSFLPGGHDLSPADRPDSRTSSVEPG